jgi:hypothetical protein
MIIPCLSFDFAPGPEIKGGLCWFIWPWTSISIGLQMPPRFLVTREPGSHTPEILIWCMACRRFGSNEAAKTQFVGYKSENSQKFLSGPWNFTFITLNGSVTLEWVSVPSLMGQWPISHGSVTHLSWVSDPWMGQWPLNGSVTLEWVSVPSLMGQWPISHGSVTLEWVSDPWMGPWQVRSLGGGLCEIFYSGILLLLWYSLLENLSIGLSSWWKRMPVWLVSVLKWNAGHSFTVIMCSVFMKNYCKS